MLPFCEDGKLQSPEEGSILTHQREHLRVVLESDFDEERKFDFTWVTNCISNLLPLYVVKPYIFQMTHLERWYDTNIWSSLIDQSSSNRKSKGRVIEERKPVGRRGDGVLRMEKSRQEYGASEDGHFINS
ncbi:hypothetical protein G9A89_014012 [Geosiphon pyriformis]|nr:hypothetical protein G9A89_014012 [Geosiphon pyriformis]